MRIRSKVSGVSMTPRKQFQRCHWHRWNGFSSVIDTAEMISGCDIDTAETVSAVSLTLRKQFQRCQCPRWGWLVKKTRGRKSRATVPLKGWRQELDNKNLTLIIYYGIMVSRNTLNHYRNRENCSSWKVEVIIYKTMKCMYSIGQKTWARQKTCAVFHQVGREWSRKIWKKLFSNKLSYGIFLLWTSF
jgi:hypothetical protein